MNCYQRMGALDGEERLKEKTSNGRENGWAFG